MPKGLIGCPADVIGNAVRVERQRRCEVGVVLASRIPNAPPKIIYQASGKRLTYRRTNEAQTT